MLITIMFLIMIVFLAILVSAILGKDRSAIVCLVISLTSCVVLIILFTISYVSLQIGPKETFKLDIATYEIEEEKISFKIEGEEHQIYKTDIRMLSVDSKNDEGIYIEYRELSVFDKIIMFGLSNSEYSVTNVYVYVKIQ